MSPDQLAALTVAFCSTVQQAGYYPMVYSSKNWMVGKIAATLMTKWIAQYNTVCEYPNPAFWQYSSSGVVAGINGSVDVTISSRITPPDRCKRLRRPCGRQILL